MPVARASLWPLNTFCTMRTEAHLGNVQRARGAVPRTISGAPPATWKISHVHLGFSNKTAFLATCIRAGSESSHVLTLWNRLVELDISTRVVWNPLPRCYHGGNRNSTLYRSVPHTHPYRISETIRVGTRILASWALNPKNSVLSQNNHRLKKSNA